LRGAAPRASAGQRGRRRGGLRVRDRRGPGHRHPTGEPDTHLRAVLHHEARGRGHGPRPVGRARHRRGARWLDRARERPRYRQPIFRVPAASPGAGEGGVVSGRVLVVDDERSMCEAVEAGLTPRGFEVRWETSAEAALATLGGATVDVVLTDINMGGMDGLALCERIVSNRPDVPVIVITAFGSLETAIAAIRAGAYDFITKPVKMDALAVALSRAVQHRSLREEVKRLRHLVGEAERFDELVGDSAAMRRVRQLLDRVIDSDASVLVTGESGTGKEVVARVL